MTTPNLEDLHTRLAALERQNRRLKGIGATALVLVGVAFLSCATQPHKVVEAERFLVKDGRGITRAELAPGHLSLHNELGYPCAELTLDKDLPQLCLSTLRNKSSVSLIISKDGPILGLSDAWGQCRAALGLDNDGPSLELYGKKTQARALLLGLGVTKAGPGFVLTDEAGKSIWSAP
jgi:hypothetical protein